MRLFWIGALVGWLAFVPSARLVYWLLGVIEEQIERPSIGFGRNRCLIRYREDDDIPEALEFLRKVGFDYKHLRGRWYWVWRVYFGETKGAG